MTPTAISLAFRLAAPADAPTMLGFIEGLYTQEHIPFDPLVAEGALMPVLTGAAPGAAWLIEAGGEAVGYLVLIFSYYLEFGPTAIVDEVYLAPAWRGKGLGTQALAFAEAESRRRGMVRMRLEVECDNPARGLYERDGFVAHDRYLMTKVIDVAGDRA